MRKPAVSRWLIACVIGGLAWLNIAWPGEAALLELEDKRLALLVTEDWDAYGALLADDFFYNHAGGGTLTRSDYLTSLRAGRTKVKEATRDGTTTRLYGDLALVTGLTHMRVIQQGAEKMQHSRYLHVWRNEARGWRLVARQATYLPDPHR